MTEEESSKAIYSYKIPISKKAVRENYNEVALKQHIIFHLHGYLYIPYDRMDYTLKISLGKMELMIMRKDGQAFSEKEWVFFEKILPEFFEELEMRYIQEEQLFAGELFEE